MKIAKLKPFRTDGCSMWPDGNYHGCCVEHDRIYWRGGSAAERLQADIDLMQCVQRKAGPLMARLMFIGICLGGIPCWPLPWRWGYGRRYIESWWYGTDSP